MQTVQLNKLIFAEIIFLNQQHHQISQLVSVFVLSDRGCVSKVGIFS
jgi:hypothetical protein